MSSVQPARKQRRHARFPRVGWLHRGYHPRQVDRFLTAAKNADGALSAADVRRAGFELVRRGYDIAAVDTALDEFEEKVAQTHVEGPGRRGRSDPERDAAFLHGEFSAPYMRRFPRARTWRRGYHIDDVDDFVDRVCATLDGVDELTVDDVRSAPFRPKRGGYDEGRVDEALDRTVELLLVLHRSPG